MPEDIPTEIKLLLIEDMEADQDLFKIRLKNFKRFELEIASTFDEALAKIQNNDYDLIVSDLNLADLNSEETVAALLSNSNLPLVVVSGLCDSKFVKNLKAMGVVEFLLKGSYTPEELAEALDKAYMMKRSSKGLQQC